ncbi:regulatory protein amda-related protein, partial [Colletotrichum incanum]
SPRHRRDPPVHVPAHRYETRPHKCLFCDRGFRKHEHLQRHTRTHTKEKPYGCECGLFFTRQDLLQRHRRVSHCLTDAHSGVSGRSRLF